MSNFSNNINKFFFLSLALFTFSLTACDDDEGAGTNEQELITTVRLAFSDGTNLAEYFFRDTDGVGGNSPVVDTIRLTSQIVMHCCLSSSMRLVPQHWSLPAKSFWSQTTTWSAMKYRMS